MWFWFGAVFQNAVFDFGFKSKTNQHC